MSQWIAFTKKELMESARTYKLLIILSVFIMFGIVNPVTAKLLPDLLASLMDDGVQIILQDPTPIDAWAQFYKNMATQLILFVIMYSGIVSNELEKGTLVHLVTKGLSRKTIILSKYTVLILIWTIAYWICFGTTYVYTLYLLPGHVDNIFIGALFMWLYGVFILSILILSSVVVPNIYGALMMIGGIVMMMMLVNTVPNIVKYNPYVLNSDVMQFITGEIVAADLYIVSIMTIMLSIFFVFLATLLFRKMRL